MTGGLFAESGYQSHRCLNHAVMLLVFIQKLRSIELHPLDKLIAEQLVFSDVSLD